MVAKESFPETPTMSTLSKRMTVDISEFSKEEIEAYGKQKTQFMYSRYGNYRILSIVFILGVSTILFLYKRRNVVRNIRGSILENDIKQMLGRNAKLQELLQARNKKHP